MDGVMFIWKYFMIFNVKYNIYLVGKKEFKYIIVDILVFKLLLNIDI